MRKRDKEAQRDKRGDKRQVTEKLVVNRGLVEVKVLLF